jgi:hypothetical protein
MQLFYTKICISGDGNCHLPLFQVRLNKICFQAGGPEQKVNETIKCDSKNHAGTKLMLSVGPQNIHTFNIPMFTAFICFCHHGRMIIIWVNTKILLQILDHVIKKLNV